METSNAGLGIHIRHDAITGDAQIEQNNCVAYAPAQEVHATVFVSAYENAGAKPESCHAIAAQNTTTQLPMPSFPAPPHHPNLMSQPSAIISTAPNVGAPSFPYPRPHPASSQSATLYPPPHAPITHQIHAPYFQPPPPPPGLSPHFPPPNNIAAKSTYDLITTQQTAHGTDSTHNETQYVSANNSLLQNNIKRDEHLSTVSSPKQQAATVVDHNVQTDVKEISDAIEKAQSIARRFHLESTQRQTTCNNNSVIHDNSIPTGIDYLDKRRAHFQKEKTKFNKFRLKNLEYVMRLDEMDLRHHVNCMNQITALEEKQSIQLELAKQQRQEMQRKLEQKRQQKTQTSMMNATAGGIGSQDQRRAERVRKRERLDQGTSLVKTTNGASSHASQRNKNSLYLTNLPTDGSATERLLHSLFSSYGRLDRVTMYRHRSTGELKGDGLIVFGRDTVDAFDNTGDGDFIDYVCLQMNGAELPCGITIGVQPADMYYKQGSNMKLNEGEKCEQPDVPANKLELVSNDREVMAACQHDTKERAVEEELDEFFASL